MRFPRLTPSRRKGRSETGQSLVEFAASLVALMLVLSGVLDIGRAFFAFVAIENGAGEGAIFAAYHPTWVTEEDVPPGEPDPEFQNITYRASHESPAGVVDWERALVGVAYEGDTAQVGEPVTVTVTYSYTVMTPFLHLVLEDGILPLRSNAAQTILSVDN
jgi:Flp pilus assembly protein TadG